MADVDKPINKDPEDKQYKKPHSVLRPAILTNHVSYEGTTLEIQRHAAIASAARARNEGVPIWTRAPPGISTMHQQT